MSAEKANWLIICTISLGTPIVEMFSPFGSLPDNSKWGVNMSGKVLLSNDDCFFLTIIIVQSMLHLRTSLTTLVTGTRWRLGLSKRSGTESQRRRLRTRRLANIFCRHLVNLTENTGTQLPSDVQKKVYNFSALHLWIQKWLNTIWPGQSWISWPKYRKFDML